MLSSAFFSLNSIFLTNGKHYLTLSSVDVKTEGEVKHAATIDYWRGYVDDENNNASSANNTISNLNYKSSMN